MSALVPEALTEAWTEFMVSQRGTYAVTLCYNPKYGGTVSTGYQINRAEPVVLPSKLIAERFCVAPPLPTDTRLPKTGPCGRAGSYRLPTVLHVAPETVQADVKRLHARVDHALYGCRYHRRPISRRTSYVGFVEHETSNIHVHLAWRVPVDRVEEFPATLRGAWSDIRPFATDYIVPVRDDGWAKYIIKAKYNVAFGDAALFLASEAPAT